MRMFVSILIVLVSACVQGSEGTEAEAEEAGQMVDVFSFETGEIQPVERLELSEEEWREKLTAEQYRIIREKKTERSFSGQYVDHNERGLYRCAACGNDLFLSDKKYDSGCGWPSFFQPIDSQNVAMTPDFSLGMRRVELQCARCSAHLGHVFPDGPKPTGQRYCVNSASLAFDPVK